LVEFQCLEKAIFTLQVDGSLVFEITNNQVNHTFLLPGSQLDQFVWVHSMYFVFDLPVQLMVEFLVETVNIGLEMLKIA